MLWHVIYAGLLKELAHANSLHSCTFSYCIGWEWTGWGCRWGVQSLYSTSTWRKWHLQSLLCITGHQWVTVMGCKLCCPSFSRGWACFSDWSTCTLCHHYCTEYLLWRHQLLRRRSLSHVWIWPTSFWSSLRSYLKTISGYSYVLPMCCQ